MPEVTESTTAPPYTRDPDVVHLLHLLSILPGSEDLEFWNNVDAEGYLPRPGDQEHELTPSGDGYLLGKLGAGIGSSLLPKAADRSFVQLAQYVLFFFDGDRPALWKLLDRYSPASDFAAEAGRRFVQELCDTAWTIAVRYDHRAGIESLPDKWPWAARLLAERSN